MAEDTKCVHIDAEQHRRLKQIALNQDETLEASISKALGIGIAALEKSEHAAAWHPDWGAD
jgi:hypothetical protein